MTPLHERVAHLLAHGVGLDDVSRVRRDVGYAAPPEEVVDLLEQRHATGPLTLPAPGEGLVVMGTPEMPGRLAETWAAGGPLWL